MNRCDLGGYLVDTTGALPIDPIDHDGGNVPASGCSNLRCNGCGQPVRSVAGRSDEKDAAKLYAVADLSTVVRSAATTRMYLCTCRTYFQVQGSQALDDPDLPSGYEANVPWRCAGHPIATLPHDFDGVTITGENLGEVVTRALHGWTPDGARPEDRTGPWWIPRLLVRLETTPWQTTVRHAAAEALRDPDPQARARALHLFMVAPDPADTQRALDAFSADRSQFVGIPDPVTTVAGDKTLEDTVWRVLAPLVGAPGRGRELARDSALTPGRGAVALYGALAANDAEWVASHALEIARATPDRIEDLIKMVKYRFPRSVPSRPVIDLLASQAN